MFRHILIAFNFTPAGRQALAQAAALARIHGARLTVLHVLETKTAELDAAAPQQCATAADLYRRFAAEAGALATGLEQFAFECQAGEPSLTVCRLARQWNVDLIVLGCHQRPGRQSLMRVDYAGITILEKSPCAVLLIPYEEPPGA
jgi:nucleotide-binding universal stress UspA family protein